MRQPAGPNRKPLSYFFAALSLFFVSLASTTSAVPAYQGETFEVTQPDGTILEFRPIGDERNGRYVTMEDYTVVRDSQGWYCYAVLDEQGNLQPSQERVTNSVRGIVSKSTDPNEYPKRLAANAERLVPTLEGLDQFDLTSTNGDSRILSIADILVIMVKFPDEDTVFSTDNFDELMNRVGFNEYGSVNDYFQEVSYGQFGVNGIVVGWYTASHNRSYYGYNDGSNWGASAELAREAVIAAENAGVDFAPFDNDNDGNVDGLFVVHAGPGAETGNNGYPWSHAWCFTCAGLPAVVADGKTINGYTMEPEMLWSGISTIGVFCHEYGHALGLPDLYDTDGSSNGIGSWCNMAGGTWNGAGAVPAHLSAWCKDRLNWLTPINVGVDLWDETLVDVEQNQAVYKLWNSGAGGNEYFLLEYRRQIGFDSLIPGCGAAIWHIDDSRSTNSNDLHRWVDLEEFDGMEDNSPGDLWLGGTFDSLSAPSATSYDGSNTEVKIVIQSTSCDPAGLLADLYVGLPPSCCRGQRGNVDSDPLDEISITDLTYLVEYLFSGGPEPACPLESNSNGDSGEELNISDLTYLVDYIFGSGPAPTDCPAF
ncbi:MAG: M6 family metalloprotease domain-containing protein [bacterium]|nr:M6 family metalloprotease domain-containing protein [bacterium]